MGRHGQSLLRHDHAHSQVSAPVLPAPQFTQFLLERFDISDMPISRATSACLSFVRCLAPSLSQPLATFSYLPTHLPSTGPTGKSYLPTIWDYRKRARNYVARVKPKRSRPCRWWFIVRSWCERPHKPSAVAARADASARSKEGFPIVFRLLQRHGVRHGPHVPLQRRPRSLAGHSLIASVCAGVPGMPEVPLRQLGGWRLLLLQELCIAHSRLAKPQDSAGS